MKRSQGREGRTIKQTKGRHFGSRRTRSPSEIKSKKPSPELDWVCRVVNTPKLGEQHPEIVQKYQELLNQGREPEIALRIIAHTLKKYGDLNEKR